MITHSHLRQWCGLEFRTLTVHELQGLHQDVPDLFAYIDQLEDTLIVKNDQIRLLKEQQKGS